MPLQAVTEHFARQSRLAAQAVSAAQAEWRSIGDNFDVGWARVGPRITLLTASAQRGAALNASSYVPRALAQGGYTDPAVADLNPGAFAGYASDGRGLDTLLYGAVVEARTVTADSLAERLAKGGSWLDMAVRTQVADAGRQATGAAITARPRTGYVRETGPKCCSRCAVLAGKFFRYNTGFLRHPSCQCTHVPVTLDGSKRSPASEPREITGLSKAERKALDDGADLSQVVNSRRGADGMTTTANAKGAARLTPDGIYRIASDREEAVRLLTSHGYLT